MSRETTDVLSADTTDVLSADTTDVLSADTTDVLSADAGNLCAPETALPQGFFQKNPCASEATLPQGRFFPGKTPYAPARVFVLGRNCFGFQAQVSLNSFRQPWHDFAAPYLLR